MAFRLQYLQIFQRRVISHPKLNVYNVWIQIFAANIGFFSVFDDVLDLSPEFEFDFNFILTSFVRGRKAIYFDRVVSYFYGIVIKQVAEVPLQVLQYINEA